MAGKWQRYAERNGIWMGEHLNRTIQRSLRVGLEALVTQTQHDSSRAAFHWVLIPSAGNVRPGAWGQSRFRPQFGIPPVGQPGDRGAGSPTVVAEVVGREMRRAVMPTVKGRQPATRFAFYNAIPEHWDDNQQVADRPVWADRYPQKYKSYRENAQLEAAQMAAYAAMESVWANAFARDAVRRIPLR
jgi:hypothetical protein